VLVDPQPRWLAVGQQTNAIEAGVTHADHVISRAGDHAFPVAGELERRGQQGHSGLYWWGKLLMAAGRKCRGTSERTF
jgi:hypothetical protein